MEAVPETMGIVPAINKALIMANEANLTREELEELEKRVMFLEDQKGFMIKGQREARKEGRQEGRTGRFTGRFTGRKNPISNAFC